MARVRRIVVSQIEGDYSNNSDKRPNGEIALYDDNDNGFDLVIHDGVNSTNENKVLGKGKIYGHNGSTKIIAGPTSSVQWSFNLDGGIVFPDGTTQSTAYVAETTVPSYKGFAAHYGRMYNEEPTLSKIVIYKSNVTPFSTIDLSTDNDDFEVSGLNGSDIVALFVIMGRSSSNPIDLETLKRFTETVIDNVILDGGVEGEFNDINIMKSAFYDNYETIAADAGELYINFEFFKGNFQVSGPTTLQVGSGLELQISNDGNGSYSLSSVLSGGTDYKIGHKVLITGDQLGGVTSTNDCIFTVTSVSDGLVTDGSFEGTAAGTSQNYNITSVTNYQLGSGFQVDSFARDSDGIVRINGWNNGNVYVVGDTFKILGSDIELSSSPVNDITVVVTSVSGDGYIDQFSISGNLPEVWNENFINDGGSDQYDTANYINTNLGSQISYNQGNVVVGATAFAGGDYVMVYENSIFGILSTGANIDYISTSGNSGFDGYGQSDTGPLYESVSSDVLSELTYRQLTNMIDESSLTPGKFYKIKDFKTCYDQPNYDIYKNDITTGNYKEGSNHPIIVFAISSNQLSVDAWQPDFPKDKIKYEFSYSTTFTTGGTAFGRITERVDLYNNRTDYDHREVLFRRYRHYYPELIPLSGTIDMLDTGSVSGINTQFNVDFSVDDYLFLSDNLQLVFKITEISSSQSMSVTGSYIPNVSSNYHKGYRSSEPNLDGYFQYYQNNVDGPEDYLEFHTFKLESETIVNNKFGDYYSLRAWDDILFDLPNNVFGEDVLSSIFGASFENNTFVNDVEQTRIGDYCQNNIYYVNSIDDNRDFDNNVIGNYFQNNTILDRFDRNSIKNGFENNYIKGDFKNNFIGDNFSGNRINNNYTDNNVGNYFQNSTIYQPFYDNQLGNYFVDNSIYQEFYGNQLGNYFVDNSIYNYFVKNNIKYLFESNTIGTYGTQSNFNFEQNTIGYWCKGNLFLEDVQSNEFGNNFWNNEFLGYTYGNKIGVFFWNNDLNTGFIGNSIGNEGQYNIFGTDSVYNTIGHSFRYNTIGNDFERNNIGNDCNDNNISYNFSFNVIGNSFYDNTIENDFGFGGDQSRGNKIGNYFYNNNVGEYFYDNIVADLFNNNIVGYDFQLNDIKATDINNEDFTTNYGNIVSFTYQSSGTTSTPGVYNVDGITNGHGGNATFSITVSGGTISDVSLISAGNQYTIGDTIIMSATSIGGQTGVIESFTLTGTQTGLVDGAYSGLTVSGGTGENALFDIEVFGGSIFTINLNNGGSGYIIGTVSIIGSYFGGTNIVDDITINVDSIYSDDVTITVTTISPTPVVYTTTNATIVRDYNLDLKLYYLGTSGLGIVNINESYN
jgi:hypothetical protein